MMRLHQLSTSSPWISFASLFSCSLSCNLPRDWSKMSDPPLLYEGKIPEDIFRVSRNLACKNITDGLDNCSSTSWSLLGSCCNSLLCAHKNSEIGLNRWWISITRSLLSNRLYWRDIHSTRRGVCSRVAAHGSDDIDVCTSNSGVCSSVFESAPCLAYA